MTTSYGALMFFNRLGPFELFLVALVLLILFGNRLPDVARSLAKSFVQFRKGLRDAEKEIRNAGAEDEDSPYLDKPSEEDEGESPESKDDKSADKRKNQDEST